MTREQFKAVLDQLIDLSRTIEGAYEQGSSNEGEQAERNAAACRDTIINAIFDKMADAETALLDSLPTELPSLRS